MGVSLKIKYLVDMAKMARQYAYMPYSQFAVGASVRTEEDNVFTGCNVEIQSLGLTICAERTAIFKAVSEGFKNIREVAIIADTKECIVPCGACLQVMMEFNPDMHIAMATVAGDIKVKKINKILTVPFVYKK